MPRSAVSWVSGAVLVAVTACGGGAGGGEPIPATVDQYYAPQSHTCFRILLDEFDHAMTFSVGRPGTLTRVDLLLTRGSGSGQDDVVFELRPTVAGVPDPDDAHVLATASLSSAEFPVDPGFVAVDLSAFGISVLPGEIYALVLRTATGTGVGSWPGVALGYDLGEGFQRAAAESTFEPGLCDVAFRSHVE